MPQADFKIKATIDDETQEGLDKILAAQLKAENTIAGRLKKSRLEERKSGESALESAISGGSEGITQGIGNLLGIEQFGVATALTGQFAEGIASVTEHLRAMRHGAESIEDVKGAMVRAIPVIGPLGGAIHDLGAEMDGTAAAEERMVQKIERGAERTAKSVTAMAAAHAELRTSARAIADEGENLGHVGESGLAQKYRKNNQQQLKDQRAIEDDRRKIVGSDMTPKVKADALKELERQHKENYQNYLQSHKDIGDQAAIDIDKDLTNAQNKAMADRAQSNIDHLQAMAKNEGRDYSATLESSFGAERAQIEENKRQKLAALDDEIKQSREKFGEQSSVTKEIADRRAQVEQEANGRIEDLRNDHQDKLKKAGNDLAAHDAETSNQLTEAKAAAAESQAKMGDLSAAQEAKRLRIAAEFNQKREALRKILRDDKASDLQKSDAQASLSGLDDQEKQAHMLANYGSAYADNVAKFSARGTGAASRAQEENSPFLDMLKAQDAQKKETEKTNVILGQLVAAVGKQVGKPALQGVA